MTRPDGRRSRAGFTLIELLVALLVGATIVLGARTMLEGVTDGARRVMRQARDDDRAANAEHVVRATVESFDLSADAPQPFIGTGREARFTAWCDRPSGWKERCIVTLSASTEGGAGVVLTAAGSPSVRLAMTADSVRLLYLSDARDGGHWVPSWSAGLTPPQAIAVVGPTDTLMLRIGERG